MMFGGQQTDQAFLDIAANTLAVIIIVTVFALAVTRDDRPATLHPDAVREPPIVFRAGRTSPLPRVSRIVILSRGRLFELDTEEVVAALLDRPDPLRGELDLTQGRVAFVHLKLAGSDANLYDFRFRPGEDYVAQLPPLREEHIEELLARWRNDWSANGIATSVVVFESALAAFEPLHERLLALDLPWRWVVKADGTPVVIRRTPSGFRSLTTYW